VHVLGFKGEEHGVIAPKPTIPRFLLIESSADLDPPIPGGTVGGSGVIEEALHPFAVDGGDGREETIGSGHGEVTHFIVANVRDFGAGEEAVGEGGELEPDLGEGGREGGRNMLCYSDELDQRRYDGEGGEEGGEGGREGGRDAYLEHSVQVVGPVVIGINAVHHIYIGEGRREGGREGEGGRERRGGREGGRGLP